MNSTQVKYLKRKLIESYMNELRFSSINAGYGITNALFLDSPSTNPVLRSRMREIENLYAQESEAKLTRRMK